MDISKLNEMGWKSFFHEQLSAQEIESATLARVISIHRNRAQVKSDKYFIDINISHAINNCLLVGDWVILKRQENGYEILRVLERFNELKRLSQHKEQMMLANIDHLIIVTSYNDDFNLSRLERYLLLANQAKCHPHIWLTKADICENKNDYLEKLKNIKEIHSVTSINALDLSQSEYIISEIPEGKTAALVGSSGVGKSSIMNLLLQKEIHKTGKIREDDSKGKHTTTNRVLSFLSGNRAIIDTPGMRELSLELDVKLINKNFDDIVDLISQCKFNNCQHTKEKGCAILREISNGGLEKRRWENYLKLNSESDAITKKERMRKNKQKFKTQTLNNKSINKFLN